MAIFSNPLFATYSVYARNASYVVCARSHCKTDETDVKSVTDNEAQVSRTGFRNMEARRQHTLSELQ